MIKVKLSPKCNLGLFCESTRVKPSCKSIIMMKEALLRFTVVLFLGKLLFNGVLGTLTLAPKSISLKH